MRGPKGGHAPPKKKGPSVTGFLGNLGTDIINAVEGLPRGMKEASEPVIYALAGDPFRAAEEARQLGRDVAASYAHTYGPLFRGNYRRFARNVYDNPLGPILDALTVVTIGAGAASKTMQIAGIRAPRTLEALAYKSPAALVQEGKLGRGLFIPEIQEGMTIPGKVLRESPFPRARQVWANRLMNTIPATTPGVGQISRFARELERAPRLELTRLRATLKPYQKAWDKLDSYERVALGAKLRGVTPGQLASLLESQAKAGVEIPAGQIALLRNPKVVSAFDNPSKALLAAEKHGRNVSNHITDILIEREVLSPEQVVESTLEPAQLVRGAKPVPEMERLKSVQAQMDVGDYVRTSKRTAPAQIKELVSEKVREWERYMGEGSIGQKYNAAIKSGDEAEAARLYPRVKEAEKRWRDASDRIESAVLAYPDADLVVPISELIPAHTQVPTRLAGALPEDKLVSQLEREGLEPTFMPEFGSTPKHLAVEPRGGGMAAPQVPEFLRQGDQSMLLLGQLALHPDVLSPAFMQTIKYALYEDLHSALLRSAVKVERTRGLPRNWEYVRRQGEKISAADIEKGKLEAELRRIVPEEELRGENLVTTAKEAAEISPDGYYLAVPRQLARRITGEFHKSSQAIDILVNRPTQVWRAIVLGYRPAFFVNNVIGNHFLYAIGFGGVDGLRGYLDAVRTVKGPQTAARLLRETPEPLRRQIILYHGETKGPLNEAGARLYGSDVEGEIYLTRTEEAARQYAEGFNLTDEPGRVVEVGYHPKNPLVIRDPNQLRKPLDDIANEMGYDGVADLPFDARLEESLDYQDAIIEWARDKGHDALEITPEAMRRVGEKGVEDIPLDLIWGHDQVVILNKSARTLHPKTGQRKRKVVDAIDQEFMNRYFPEQTEGTFGQTQFPEITNPRTRRWARRAGAGIIPETQAVAEGVLRRASIITMARKSPQVKAILKKMPRETRNLRKAAEQALDENPLLARQWSDRVNEVLGDYLTLSPFERSAVRAAMPFYAWYRAITLITLKMPFSTPGRANILAHLGMIGTELNEDELGPMPEYLSGAMPVNRRLAGALLGGVSPNLTPILTTGGLNPFATVADVGRASHDLALGKPGEAAPTFGSMINPWAGSTIEWLTGKKLFTGGEVKQEWGLPGLAGLVENTIVSLPPYQLMRKPSELYPRRDLRSQILAYLGLPVRQINKREARQEAKKKEK